MNQALAQLLEKFLADLVSNPEKLNEVLDIIKRVLTVVEKFQSK